MTTFLSTELQVATACDNSSHGHDQVLSVTVDGKSLLLVADGVTMSTEARLASGILAVKLLDQFSKLAQESKPLSAAAIANMVERAVDHLAEQFHQLILEEQQRREAEKTQAEVEGLFSRAQSLIREAHSKIAEFYKRVASDNSPANGREGEEDVDQEVVAPKIAVDLVTQLRVQNDFKLLEDRDPTLEAATAASIMASLQKLSDAELAFCDPQTTLALVVLDCPSNGKREGFAYALGDSSINILRPSPRELSWLPWYEAEEGKSSISSYVSSRDGIVGIPSVSSWLLYPGDVVVVSTDGAYVHWTTRGGFRGVPFKRLLTSSGEQDLAVAWLEYLKSQTGQLDDDASLIIARLLPNEADAGSREVSERNEEE